FILFLGLESKAFFILLISFSINSTDTTICNLSFKSKFTVDITTKNLIELKYNTLNASTDTLQLTVHGSKCHGAYPHQGIDAIVIS
ncbi:hypothetical protein ACTPEM_24395, partial [Clostridioides difficile]